MRLEEWLNGRDGAAHTSDIYAAGFSRHAVSTAVDSRRVLRLRRSWIASKSCDPPIRAAISIGGRLTCVSAARRLELWTPADDHVHAAVTPTAARFDPDGMRVHWSSGPAPVGRHAVVDPLINVLYQVARCQEPATALAIWESALRKRLIAPEVVSRIEWRSARASRIAEFAGVLSDSGLESHFVMLMHAIGVRVTQQVWVDGHPLDALIGDLLAVQLDGFAFHSGAAERRRDIEADARLRLRGYSVLRFDYHQVLFQPELVQTLVRAAVAQGLHLRG